VTERKQEDIGVDKEQVQAAYGLTADQKVTVK